MSPLQIILFLLQLYIWVIIIDVILNWLVAFEVINRGNAFVQQFHQFTYQITNPFYKRIRSVIPPVGGLDLSPLFLILGVYLVMWMVGTVFSFLPFM